MYRVYKISLATAILAVAALTFGFQENPSRNESILKNLTTDYVKTFNSRDSEKLADFWASDAIYVNVSTHETLQGRSEIENYFKEQFQEFDNLKLDIVIDSVKFDSSGQAIEKGTAITTSPNEPEKKSVFMAELKPLNNSWKLQKVIEVDVQAPPSHYEQLKDLEWLIGQWTSRNDYVELVSKTAWDENKNFLIQNFSVDILGQKNLDAKQIIGWDPSNKKIRSWMIDSDGGFGEASWSPNGNLWYVEMVYTLPDGRKASVTHVYKKIDEKTFTFSSEDRDIDGKILPNVKPFTLTKVQ